MKKWLAQFRANRREKHRQRLLALIGRDIENIAADAYREGCHITRNRMRAERLLEFKQLMATNEKLQELMLEHSAIDLPTMILPAALKIPEDKGSG